MVLKISVIIPTLNEQQTIAAAIDSATRSGADEIIVVDGGSSDQTTQRAARTAVVVVKSSRAGRAAQQNMGAQRASGDVLLFLHADCRLSANSVAELRDRLSLTPQIIAGCFRQRIDQPGLRYRVLEAGNLWRARLLKWAYGDQGIFVRTSVFRQHNGFPNVCFLEDLLMMKQLRHSGRIVVLDSHIEVSARRWQRRGILRQTLRNWMIVGLAQLGISPQRLAEFYPNDR